MAVKRHPANCKTCGKEFMARTYPPSRNSGTQEFCCRTCAQPTMTARAKKTLAQRVEDRFPGFDHETVGKIYHLGYTSGYSAARSRGDAIIASLRARLQGLIDAQAQQRSAPNR